MANLNEIEVEYMSKFLEKFTPCVEKGFSQNVDKDVFKKFAFNIESMLFVGDIEKIKGNNIFYELDYIRNVSASSLAVLIQEELIADISDVVTGGSGKDAYNGSLSELEVNSISDILPKVFREVETAFQKLHEQNLAFDADPLFLTKSDKKNYNDKFDNLIYDYVVNYKVVVNDEQEYTMGLLLKSSDIKATLRELQLYNEDILTKTRTIEAIGIDHLTDVKINITAELGKAKVPIKYAMELIQGSLVELDTQNGEDIRVYANGIEVARAQVVAIGDNFGLRITKIISPEERMNFI